MTKSGFDAEFDVVVVGAGSAGCVLSARLTENPNVSLCVIEAGGRDRNPWIHVPMGFGKLVPNPKMNWGYETEPEAGLGGRRIIWPRGKVLGGSGSINGLVFLRGAPSDYDEWQRLGARGWSYKDVLPYFKRMEHCVDGANEWRLVGRETITLVQHVRECCPHDIFTNDADGITVQKYILYSDISRVPQACSIAQKRPEGLALTG